MSQKGRPRPEGPHMPPQGASSHGLTHIFYNLELIKREKLNKLSMSKN